MPALPMKTGGRLEDAKMKLPVSPSSLLIAAGSVCSHAAEFTYSQFLPRLCD